MNLELLMNYISRAMLQIGEMSLVASIIICIVIVVRFSLKKMPRIFSYALWSVVLFRLLCPISISSQYSVMNLIPIQQKLEETMQGTESYLETTLLESIGAEASAILPGKIPEDTATENHGATYPVSEKVVAQGVTAAPVESTDDTVNQTTTSDISKTEFTVGRAPHISLATILGFSWLSGVLIIGSVGVGRFIHVRKRIFCRMKLRENIYLADGISTPFCMGILRPKIYLPSHISPEEQEYIILHEKYHIKRGDILMKPLAFAALCLHWFNPLVWLAFAMAGRDLEMSCDEAVISKMNEENRSAYAMTLLRVSTGRRSVQLAILSFGEGDPKARIKGIMQYKKPTAFRIGIAVVVCLVSTFTLSTNAASLQEADKLMEGIIREDNADEQSTGGIITPTISASDVNEEVNSASEAICLGDGKVIYSFAYNDGQKESPQYYEHYGEWMRPLGLQTFVLCGDKVFIDDSANQRVIMVQNGQYSYLTIPENYVCVQMKVVNRRKLIVTLLDNLAVEPQYLWGAAKMVDDGEMTLTRDDIRSVDTVLNEIGSSVDRPVIAYRSLLWDRFCKELGEYLGIEAEGTLQYVDMHEEYQLWKYTPKQYKSDDFCYFVVHNEQIVGYTNLLRGDTVLQAVLNEEDGLYTVSWMELQSANEFVIRQSDGIKTDAYIDRDVFHYELHKNEMVDRTILQKTQVFIDPDSRYEISTAHLYKRGEGEDGPIYGICHVKEVYGTLYARCALCYEIDSDNPQTGQLFCSEHENCGKGIVVPQER